MAFQFEWNRMRKTPEGELARKQLIDRRDMNSLEGAARTYEQQAIGVLEGPDGVSAKDEISRFAEKILGKSGLEQEAELERLASALQLRKRSIFGDIPDEKHERLVFALALVHAYEQSLH